MFQPIRLAFFSSGYYPCGRMWSFLRFVAILGWLFGLIGGLLLDLQIAPIVLALMLVIHTVELPLALYFACRNGYAPVAAAIRTFLFGFLYCIPTFVLEQNRKGETACRTSPS